MPGRFSPRPHRRHPADLYTCNGTGVQQWLLGPAGELINPESCKCLDDLGDRAVSGTKLILRACSRTAGEAGLPADRPYAARPGRSGAWPRSRDWPARGAGQRTLQACLRGGWPIPRPRMRHPAWFLSLTPPGCGWPSPGLPAGCGGISLPVSAPRNSPRLRPWKGWARCGSATSPLPRASHRRR